jgi:hypothetical protein
LTARCRTALERRLREELLEAAEVRHRQHVELETQPGRQSAVPLRDRRGQALGRGELDHHAERRLRARALDDLAHEQRRHALPGHVEVRLLDGARVVVQVGVLLQESGVETQGRKAGLQAGDAALQLRGRHHCGSRLDQTPALPAHVTHRS